MASKQGGSHPMQTQEAAVYLRAFTPFSIRDANEIAIDRVRLGSRRGWHAISSHVAHKPASFKWGWLNFA